MLAGRRDLRDTYLRALRQGRHLSGQDRARGEVGDGSRRILILIGLLGLWEGSGAYSFGKPGPGMGRWRNPAGGERIGGLLIMIFGAICVVAGIVLVVADLIS